MIIHYDLIGAYPQAEVYRDTLPALIEKFQAEGRSADAALICMCAAHFYGLSFIRDFQTMDELIDAIKAADQQLEHA